MDPASRRIPLVVLGVWLVAAGLLVAVGWWGFAQLEGAQDPEAPGVVRNPPAMRQRLSELFDQAGEGEQVGQLRDLTDFDWEVAYVFGEYTPAEVVRDVVGGFDADEGWTVPTHYDLFAFKRDNGTAYFALLGDVSLRNYDRVAWPPNTRLISDVDHAIPRQYTLFVMRFLDLEGPPIAVDPPQMRERLSRMLERAGPNETVGHLRDVAGDDWWLLGTFDEQTSIEDIRFAIGNSPAPDGWVVPEGATLFVSKSPAGVTSYVLLTGVTILHSAERDRMRSESKVRWWGSDTVVVRRERPGEASDVGQVFISLRA
jgi:hypothetical protein